MKRYCSLRNVSHREDSRLEFGTANTRGTLAGSIPRIANEVTGSVETDFFDSLVKHLAEAVTADCVYIGEFVGGQVERLRVLAAWVYGAPGSKSDYILAGTFAAQVATGKPCKCTQCIQRHFVDDSLLLEARAQAGVALPLLDSRRQVLGVLIALYNRSITNADLSKSTLESVAPYASAELHRKQIDAALRESEQRYRMFITENSDAMWRIEFETPVATNLPEDDQIEKIYRYGYLAECNPAMARLLDYQRSEQLIGFGFAELAKRADRRIQEHIRSAIRSGYQFATFEVEHLDLAGNRRSLLRSHWGIVENGMLRRIWGTHRDITRRGSSKISEGPSFCRHK